MLLDIALQTFYIKFIVRGGEVYITGYLTDKILNEMFMSDNIPKHEINLA